jgi:hypothetical protein
MNNSQFDKTFGDEGLKLMGKIAIFGVPTLVGIFFTIGLDWVENRVKKDMERDFVRRIEFIEYQRLNEDTRKIYKDELNVLRERIDRYHAQNGKNLRGVK